MKKMEKMERKKDKVRKKSLVKKMTKNWSSNKRKRNPRKTS